MANERTTAGPLTATVGERLQEHAREGAGAGVQTAQEAVEDIRRAAYEEEQPQGAVATGRTPPRSSPRPRRGAGGSGLGWALAAGIGTFALVRIVRRAIVR